jgi:hypothetical protein
MLKSRQLRFLLTATLVGIVSMQAWSHAQCPGIGGCITRCFRAVTWCVVDVGVVAAAEFDDECWPPAACPWGGHRCVEAGTVWADETLIYMYTQWDDAVGCACGIAAANYTTPGFPDGEITGFGFKDVLTKCDAPLVHHSPTDVVIARITE